MAEDLAVCLLSSALLSPSAAACGCGGDKRATTHDDTCADIWRHACCRALPVAALTSSRVPLCALDSVGGQHTQLRILWYTP